MKSERSSRAFHVVKNPFSVALSAYYSHLSSHPDVGWANLIKQRRLLLSMGSEAGMFATVAFLERSDFAAGSVGPFHGLRSWNYSNDNFTTIKAEDFFRRPSEFAKLIFDNPDLTCLPDEDFAFTNFSGGRQIGETDKTSHYRSGDTEEWRTRLPKSIINYIAAHFDELLRAAYPELLQNSHA